MKELSLSEEGGVVARSTANNLVSGDCEVVECSPRQFAESFLPSLTDRQCTSYGIPRDQAAKQLTTKKRMTDQMRAEGYLARDNEHVVWPLGPAILMIDYDPEEGAELDRNELLQSLYAVCPEILECAHVHGYSSSSFIYNRETGDQLSDAKGQRVYIFVESGRDIPRAADVLFKRAWLLGYGRIAISKSGQLLTRC